MANVIETAKETTAGAAQTDGGFLHYLSTYGGRLLVVAIIVALVVYIIIYMRKRFPIVREFMVFLKERKLWWMTPIVVIFIFLAILIVTMESSAIAPFIYALF
jgi:hypothetical protein